MSYDMWRYSLIHTCAKSVWSHSWVPHLFVRSVSHLFRERLTLPATKFFADLCPLVQPAVTPCACQALSLTCQTVRALNLGIAGCRMMALWSGRVAPWCALASDWRAQYFFGVTDLIQLKLIWFPCVSCVFNLRIWLQFGLPVSPRYTLGLIDMLVPFTARLGWLYFSSAPVFGGGSLDFTSL